MYHDTIVTVDFAIASATMTNKNLHLQVLQVLDNFIIQEIKRSQQVDKVVVEAKQLVCHQ